MGLLILILAALPAWGATCTSRAAGDRSDKTVWGTGSGCVGAAGLCSDGTSPCPGIGDTVSIGHAVSVAADWTVGTSPTNGTTMVVTVTANGLLTVGDYVTVLARGNCDFQHGNGGTVGNGLVLGPGSRFLIDPSVSATLHNLYSRNRSLIYARGTAQNPAVIGTVDGITAAQRARLLPYSGTGALLDAQYLVLQNLGATNSNGVTSVVGVAPDGVLTACDHCWFKNSGRVQLTRSNDTGVIRITNSRLNSIVTSNPAAYVTGTASPGAPDHSSLLQGNVVVGSGAISGLILTNAPGVDVVDNYFDGGTVAADLAYAATGQPDVRRNMVVVTGASSAVMSASYIENVQVVDQNAANTTARFAPAPAISGRTYSGNLIAYTYSSILGDFIHPDIASGNPFSAPNDPGEFYLYGTNNIFEPGLTGKAGGKLFSYWGTNVHPRSYIEHNTAPSYQEAQFENALLGVGESSTGVYPGYVGQIQTLKSNLAWNDNPTGQGAAVAVRWDHDISDIILPAGADYNWWQNPTANDPTLTGYVRSTGARATPMFTAPHDANSQSGDPRLVDSGPGPRRRYVTASRELFGRTPANWATATAYAVGDFVTAASEGNWYGLPVNYRCITAHTSESGHATNGQPITATSWRTNWEYATRYELRGDDGPNGVDPAKITLLRDWLRRAWTPQNPAAWCAGHDGESVGAVPFCAQGKAMLGAIGAL